MVFMVGMDWMVSQVLMVFQEHRVPLGYRVLMVRTGTRGTRESEDLWDHGENEDYQDREEEPGKMDDTAMQARPVFVPGRLPGPALKKKG